MRLTKNFAFVVGVLLLIGVFIFTCGKMKNEYVARVGGRRISVGEFEKAFAEGKRTREIQASSLEIKKKYLEKLIDKKLQLIDAYKTKLDQDETLKKQVEEREKNLLFRRLVEREVIEKIVTEDRIEEYYKNASKQVKIRQIVLNYDKNNPQDKDQKVELAKNIIERIKSGENFSDLAKEKSRDTQSAKDGGMKGYLKWGTASSTNPILVAAFSLKTDEISEPIVAQDGIYIIKVVHIKKLPAPPFEQEKEKIKQSIFRLFNKEIEQAYYDYLKNLKRKYKVNYVENNIDFFFTQLKSKPEDKNGGSNFDKFSQTDAAKILAEIKFKDIKVSDLLENIKQIPSHRQPNFRTVEDIREYLDKRMIPIYLLEKEIDVSSIKNDKQFKDQIRDIFENLMMREIYQRQVSDNVKLTEEDFKKYFEENRNDYKNPPMRDVQEIYVTDDKIAKQIVTQARAGKNFTELFKKYNEKALNEKNLGKLGLISEGRGGYGKPAFAVKVGGVTDPIKIGRGFSIVKVFSEQPETLKTYEESERLVQARLRRLKTTQVEEAWLAELRSKANIVIYEKNLDQACKKYIGSDVILID